MRDSEILAMLENNCPMCGPADCACTATEQDQYREIQRLRLTDEERDCVRAAIRLLEHSTNSAAARARKGLLSIYCRLAGDGHEVA